MDIEYDQNSPSDNMYIVRYDDMEYHTPAPNITFLGEFLLEPDRDMDGPGGDDVSWDGLLNLAYAVGPSGEGL